MRYLIWLIIDLFGRHGRKPPTFPSTDEYPCDTPWGDL